MLKPIRGTKKDAHAPCQPRVSFTALSKVKTRANSLSELQSKPACSPRQALMFSQMRPEDNCKENVRDEYRLFENAIKGKREAKERLEPKKTAKVNPLPVSEYWNIK